MSAKRRIDEIDEEIENTVVSDLKNCKFSIQLDESALSVAAILMAYVKYCSKIKEQVTGEFLFAKHLETDEKERKFKCLQECLNKYDIPLENIIGSGFATFLPGVHCVLHRNNLPAKYLCLELHKALQFCIKCTNQIKAQPL